MACDLVEGGGEFAGICGSRLQPPQQLPFVDGTMRVEVQGTVTGLKPSWGADAVLAEGHRPLRFDRVTIGRAAVFSGGQRVALPPQPVRLSWEADSLADSEPDNIWRTLPVIGYVKTHHRPMLAGRMAAGAEPAYRRTLRPFRHGQRTFTAATCGSACRVRRLVTLAGIVRRDVLTGVGLALAEQNAAAAAGWPLGSASAHRRNWRAPVNLAPIADPELHLHPAGRPPSI